MEHLKILIQAHRRFLITTHMLPDGDGLGSEMALHAYLKGLGKQSEIINTHETPDKFRLLDPAAKHIRVYDGKQSLKDFDAVIVLDTADRKMLGILEAPLMALSIPIVFIDHHVFEEGSKLNMNEKTHFLVNERCGSTGELVYDIFKYLGASLNAEIATALYVAIMTDTLSFRLRQTTARTHRIAAELLELGLRPEALYQDIYGKDSVAKVKLLGHALERIESTSDGKVTWLQITLRMREKFHATVEDTEAYINHLILIDGVFVAIVFREDDDGRIKVSLRGNHDLAVFGIAKKFGGGGHRSAAGARVAAPLKKVVSEVVAEASKLIRNKSEN